MSAPLRHRCRNPRCRMKLSAPVENEHHAFCCRGCFDSFYLSRCRVCEKPLRDKRGGRRYCRPPNNCAAEARKWPHVYEYGLRYVEATSPSRSAHFTGLKSAHKGDRRPPFRCLRDWRWTDEVDLELELHDQAGQLLARLEHNRGRYRLTHPQTFPILSWPEDPDLAKRRAENVALGALALDPVTKARVDRDNAAGHPMGPPVNRPWPPIGDGEVRSDWRPSDSGIALEIPDFMRRRP
jgi:hypothetical protein